MQNHRAAGFRRLAIHAWRTGWITVNLPSKVKPRGKESERVRR